MLVLSRTINESIMIGDDIEVLIVNVRGGKVRLGIIAPNNIPVHRREIYDKVLKEKGKPGQRRRRTQSRLSKKGPITGP